jgi:hypothetical protein
MRHRQYGSSTAFNDFLFNTLLAFVCFFVVALWMVNPKVKNEKNIEAKAEMVITVTWNKDCPDDVDTWVQDPTGRHVCFQGKENGLMHLDRDDLGWDNDKIETPSGTFEYNENREVVTIRGWIPGEYTVNVHMYSKRVAGTPTEVTVILEKINPLLKLCGSKKVILEVDGEEITAFRFTVNKEGEITEINSLQKEIATPKFRGRYGHEEYNSHEDEFYGEEPGEEE